MTAAVMRGFGGGGSAFVESFGARTLSGRKRVASDRPAPDTPLLVAIHGGTYSSLYFDVPGYSLLDRAEANGLPIVAIDRPCYGETTPLAQESADIARNAEELDAVVGELLEGFAAWAAGVVLIGHSIGGAVALSIAARHPSWPLLGVAVSGVCLRTPPGDAVNWGRLPPGMVDMPRPIKDVVMFGPEGTFKPEMPVLSHQADAPVPRAELLDIVGGWPATARQVLAGINVPVHMRQGEFDRLWITDAEEVAQFAAACSGAPYVDATLFLGAGHCIDFHWLGASFQLEQIAFASRCAAMATQAS